MVGSTPSGGRTHERYSSSIRAWWAQVRVAQGIVTAGPHTHHAGIKAQASGAKGWEQLGTSSALKVEVIGIACPIMERHHFYCLHQESLDLHCCHNILEMTSQCLFVTMPPPRH